MTAIKASPAFHERLLQQVRLNGCGNVRAVNAALSDSAETLRFILASSRNMGASSIVPYDGPAESTFDIEAQPIAAVLTEDDITNARVIKIDVEGAEGSLVRGMAPVLGKLRPDAEITVEVTPDRMQQLGESVDELLETFRAHDFHTYRLVNSYASASYPAALQGEPAAPVRWQGGVVKESDLIFSRADAEELG